MIGSNDLTELALEMAWSLWTELGVKGWIRRHTWYALDVEPLILFTARLGDMDVRLKEEALQWCVANGRLTSGVRLRNLLRTADDRTEEAFGPFAAFVKAHAHVSWPGAAEPITLERSVRRPAIDLRRPGLIQLRLRAITGVSVRAELLRLMVAEPVRPQSASELAVASAYGKGNIAAALEMLVMSGVVEAQRVGNQLRYRLVRHLEVVALAGGAPPLFPDWAAIFRVSGTLLDFAASAPKEPLVRAAEIRRILRELTADLRRLGLTERIPQTTGEALNEDFDRWALELLREWAAVEEVAEAPTEATYTVHRLSTGDWLATVADRGGPPRHIGFPKSDGPAPDQLGSDTVIADDSTGAPLLAHAMLIDAQQRVGVDISPYWSADPTQQIVARAFAEERLRPMRSGQAASFTDGFLRRWYADRLRRLAVS